MENKFELLEDFQTYKPTLHLHSDTEVVTFSQFENGSVEEATDSHATIDFHIRDTKWGPKEYQTSNHPLKLMVCI